jgi:putative hydrolase
MVLIPAGAAAPGTSTTRYSEKLEFNQRYLSCVHRIIIYKYRYIVLFLVESLSFIFSLTIYLGPKVLDIREDYHVHSSYNDHSSPDLTVKNALDKAAQVGLKTLAFTEHVRRSSSWVPSYVQEINDLSQNSTIKIITGFEAKILSDGSIDCLEDYSKRYMIIASFHTAYKDKRIWTNALIRAIENPHVDIIGHLAPEPVFSINPREIEFFASKIAENEKIVEINAKYHRPPIEWILIFKDKGVKFQLGSDAHSVSEIGQFEKISHLISLVKE